MLKELFVRQAETVGAVCLPVRDRQGAIEAVVGELQREGAGVDGAFAVWADRGFLAPGERRQILDLGVGVRFEVTRESAAQAVAGVSVMDWGVARTGTLISDSSAVDQRLCSTLPPVHIALLPVSRIEEEMGTVLAKMDPSRSPFIAAITGPSRTADIERVLTIGVHGPRKLVIVLIGDCGHE